MKSAVGAGISLLRSVTVSLFAGALAVPLLLLVLLSVARDWTYPDLWPRDLQWTQWSLLAADSQGLLTAVLRSLGIGLAVAFSATALAFVSSRRVTLHRRRDSLLSLALLPFAISPVVLGVSLNYGWIQLHLAGNVFGVMLAQFLFAYAYGVLLLQGFWNARIAALCELAASLGASESQIWRRVRLPLARGLLGVCLFQTFLISWFDFALARLVGAGRVQTLPLKVFEYFGSGDFRLAAACGLLLVLPPFLALTTNRRLMAWPGALEPSRD
ncbi:MAG: ABC transporter permease [Panacagrimonas sp.]